MLDLAKTDLTFEGLRSASKRKLPVRCIVLHHTGGLRPPEGVYWTLRARIGDTPKTQDGLSVHFVVGVDGKTFQFAATDLVCLHASAANPYSVGIEFVSAGIAGTPMHASELEHGVVRQRYVDHIHKRDIALLDFRPLQYGAMFQLVEHLCDELGIPRRVPVDADGQLLRRRMSARELAKFAGVMGHYHCHGPAPKVDPGTRPLDALRQRWATAGQQ